MIFAHFAFSFPAAIALLLGVKERGNSFRDIQDPEILSFIGENVCYGFIMGSTKFYFVLISAAITMGTAAVAGFILTKKIFSILKREKAKMSMRTLKLHRQMTFSLILQVNFFLLLKTVVIKCHHRWQKFVKNLMTIVINSVFVQILMTIVIKCHTWLLTIKLFQILLPFFIFVIPFGIIIFVYIFDFEWFSSSFFYYSSTSNSNLTHFSL